MKAKFFMSLLLVFFAVSLYAQNPFVDRSGEMYRISLLRTNIRYVPTGAKPFSLDEPMEVSLDAYLTEEAILIYSSSDLASVQIELSSDNGVVYSSETNMVANEPISIILSGFSSGIYTLYIKVGESEYIGFVYL